MACSGVFAKNMKPNFQKGGQGMFRIQSTVRIKRFPELNISEWTI